MNTVIVRLKRVFPIIVIVGFIVVVSIYLPYKNKFAFSPTPQNGQIGGINGVYVYEDGEEMFESCRGYAYSYNVFRFFEDGVVLAVSLCLEEDIIKSWSDISVWLQRDNDDKTISRGEYFISGNQIWFRTTAHYDFDNNRTVIADYSGMFSESDMILDIYGHRFNSRIVKEIKFLKVDVER